MPADIKAILQLEVPLIVQIAMRIMTVEEVTSLVPGAIIELPKPADDELELLVNNKPIGTGTAVKGGLTSGNRYLRRSGNSSSARSSRMAALNSRRVERARLPCTPCSSSWRQSAARVSHWMTVPQWERTRSMATRGRVPCGGDISISSLS
ncbi:MAG: FliM/FliN family flagellar motor switch protein, partial [Planctomycetes bacterium]|nr:FliM/FliN family flagellar motor switch protein [Planctomycetota bacterium]